ncbi:N-acetyltransferase [Sphingosinicella sp. LHD-64]|uniref:GNAT family N-acetyltransferase n=1 Tax=Sphingosinicella sp. LHD-64 TaxID=3072139 RepID=UPI00280CEA6C|nr:N-acetyltransferase [Sphingosinicella sp. LHD-64]MDQ8757955.1 N-acetyltransferase [Sphingosinicella sp. LHD-64]
MLIRPFEPADAPVVWTILEPAIRGGEVFALPTDMIEADAIAHWCAPDRATFVAEEEGRVLGTYYIRANQAGPGAHVANGGYATAPEAAGRGVARAMCLDSLKQARARGFRAMQFNFVASSNDRAVRLWESCGFAIVGRLPGAFAHPRLGEVDALVMFRRL